MVYCQRPRTTTILAGIIVSAINRRFGWLLSRRTTQRHGNIEPQPDHSLRHPLRPILEQKNNRSPALDYVEGGIVEIEDQNIGVRAWKQISHLYLHRTCTQQRHLELPLCPDLSGLEKIPARHNTGRSGEDSWGTEIASHLG
jgi:hypothetical protein